MLCKNKNIFGFVFFAIVISTCIVLFFVNQRNPLRKKIWLISSETGKRIEVTVEGYAFVKSIGLGKKHTEYEKSFLESIQQLKDKQAENNELKDFYKKALESEQQFLGATCTSWEKWPYVVLSRVFLEKAKPTKGFAACQYEVRNVDIGFLLYSKQDVEVTDLIVAVRKATKEIELLSDETWAQIPVRTSPLFNNNGNITDRTFIEFMDDSVFLEQH